MLFGSNLSVMLDNGGSFNPDPLGQALEAIATLVQDYHVDVVEISLEELFQHEGMKDRTVFQEFARAQQRHGIAFTVHLPFGWIDLASGNEPVRAASVETVVRAVELTAPIDVTSYVVHATGIAGEKPGRVVTHPEEDRRLQIAVASAGRSLRDLRERQPDAPLAVENLPGIPYEWQSMFVERYDMGVCCDVGHLILQYRDPLPFLDRWSSRLRQLHLHGVQEEQFAPGVRYRQDHQALGCDGDLVDSVATLSRLKTLGFTGPVIIENDYRPDLELSLSTLRQADHVTSEPEVAYSTLQN